MKTKKPTTRSPRNAITRKPQIRLDDRGVKALRNGHPWVFRNGVMNDGGNLKPGEISPLFDQDGRFVAHALYEPKGAIAFRLVSRHKGASMDEPYFRSLAHTAWQKRASLAAEGLTTYRLVNQEADQLPGLSVTRYGEWLLAIQYVESMDSITMTVAQELLSTTGLKGVYKQERFRPSGSPEMRRVPPSRLLLGEEAPLEQEVLEDGLKYLVDITAPMGVGFFPDYRLGRRLIRQLAPGRRLLNLFSYTGAFSVAALAGGATETVSVDASQKANTKALQNAQLNGFSPEQFKTITGEVQRTVNELAVKGERFELAVVDPPTFSKGKGGTWSTARDYTNLVRSLIQLMEPGGHILFTSNMAKMSMESFERALALGAGYRHLTILERVSTPSDYPELPGFPEGSYLKSLLTRID